MLLRFTPNSDNSNDESYEPWGVAADPNGLYVVSDHHNHHIQVRIKSEMSSVPPPPPPTSARWGGGEWGKETSDISD